MKYSDFERVVISEAEGAAVHYLMFPWRTACGIVFDERDGVTTDARLTCKRCPRTRVEDWDAIFETSGMGITMVRARNNLSYYADLDKPPHYSIHVYNPGGVGDEMYLSVCLQEESTAESLARVVADWCLAATLAARENDTDDQV